MKYTLKTALSEEECKAVIFKHNVDIQRQATNLYKAYADPKSVSFGRRAAINIMKQTVFRALKALGTTTPLETIFEAMKPLQTMNTMSLVSYKDGVLIVDIDKDWILFDNENDSYQLNNLIDNPDAAHVKQYLKSEMQKWMERTGDKGLDWQNLIKSLNLVDLWNTREKFMHPNDPRIII